MFTHEANSLPHQAVMEEILHEKPDALLRGWSKTTEGNTYTALVQEEFFRLHTLLVDHPGIRISGDLIARMVDGYHSILDQSPEWNF